MKNMKRRSLSELSNKVFGCVIKVHKALEPGLIESTWQQCLADELDINQGFLIKFNPGFLKSGLRSFVL
jgi:hypothetical protein